MLKFSKVISLKGIEILNSSSKAVAKSITKIEVRIPDLKSSSESLTFLKAISFIFSLITSIILQK